MRGGVYRKRRFLRQPAQTEKCRPQRSALAGPFDEFLQNRSLAILGLMVLLLALAVRLITWAQLLPHIDEPATLLAIEIVATRGIPLFPSDVLYLQGTLISYLGAPFSFLFSGAELLSMLQAANLFASLAVVVLVYLITFRITESVFAGLFAAFGIALDPSLVTWSIWVRPYGLLAIETTALVYCFLVMIQEGTAARIGRVPVRYAMVGLFWLGTLTHIGVWMILPSMIVVAGMIWGTDLLGRHNRLVTAGALAVAAPIALTILGSLVGVGNTTTSNEGGAGFVGDHIFNVNRILNPALTFRVWEPGDLARKPGLPAHAALPWRDHRHPDRRLSPGRNAPDAPAAPRHLRDHRPLLRPDRADRDPRVGGSADAVPGAHPAAWLRADRDRSMAHRPDRIPQPPHREGKHPRIAGRDARVPDDRLPPAGVTVANGVPGR